MQVKSDKVLTLEYLNWYSKLTDLPITVSDKLRSKLYNRYKKKTGLDPGINSETSKFPQIEKDTEEKTLFVPWVNVQSISSKRQFTISVLPKDPEERRQH